MNFAENHKWVCFRLAIAAVFTLLLTSLLKNYTSNEQFSSYQQFLGYTIGFSSLVAFLIFFFLLKVKKDALIDLTDNMARNAYIMATMLIFTGFITYTSSANRVANFFFLMGTISLLLAHVLYFFKIKRAAN